MSDATEMPDPKIGFTNYPPSSGEVTIRPIAFGSMGPACLMLTMDVNDEGVPEIDLTLSNAAEHGEVKQFLDDAIAMLQIIAEQVEPLVEAALDRQEAENIDDDLEEDDDDEF